jgi:aerobic carbon-monoxide dehydrogenase medium subunit
MYSAEFDYHRAHSLAEAHQLMAANPGAKLLAGGHSLIPLLKLRLAMPTSVIDIGRIAELRGITVAASEVRIGALTTHAELAASADLRRAAAALAEAAGMVGDPAVRNRGTIGGNIAHADPASDLPTVLVALGAHIHVVGPRGARTIDASHFFTGIMATALEEDEIVSSIVVPAAGRGEASAYAKFPHPASRYAVVGAAALVIVSQGKFSAVSAALGGLLPHARRLSAVEHALVHQPATDEAIAAAAARAADDIGDQANGDLFASAEYRKAVAPVYVKRALASAVARASSEGGRR